MAAQNAKATRLLLVEDDPNLGDILQEYLTLKGFKTTLCHNGLEGYEAFKKSDKDFDMAILDVMMPVMDGFTLAKKIRTTDTDIPIIFLTAKSMKEDKVEGFKLGGDDYMTKPFSMEELQLRINAVLRRSQHKEPETLNMEEFEIGEYSFNHVQQLLSFKGDSQKLTTKESALLKMLAETKNDVLSRSEALEKIWGDDNYFTARSMDVFITKLRKYLKEDSNVEIINVHGKGYKLVDMPR
ncbi:MAG: response regulator transcription factor [Chitinophagales bacterium]